jgi:hypothetical protein
MNKKTLALLMVVVLAAGGSMFVPRMAQPAVEGEKPPVILQSFASKELRPGDVWKVYLKASDPEGKMRYIFATISQPGVGTYPVSITRIKGENQKELSGYLYLSTARAVPTSLFNLTLTLAVNIQGKGGVFSQPVFFPLSFSPQSVREAPPDGVFSEQNLGPIMINLRTVGGKKG